MWSLALLKVGTLHWREITSEVILLKCWKSSAEFSWQARLVGGQMIDSAFPESSSLSLSCCLSRLHDIDGNIRETYKEKPKPFVSPKTELQKREAIIRSLFHVAIFREVASLTLVLEISFYQHWLCPGGNGTSVHIATVLFLFVFWSYDRYFNIF